MGDRDGRVEPAIIALMAKAPLVGETKTRLATLLGADAAAELSAQFLADTLATARQVPEATVWIVCPDERHRRALAELVPGGVDVLAQPEPGLMAGLDWAFGAGFAAGAAKVLLIDADSPTRPVELFGEALRRLEQADLCLGPSPDGGYHLIGARRICPGLFDGVAASTGDTYSQTLARAGALGLSTTALPRWRDVDTPEDLRALVAELGGRRNGAPATRAWLERSGWLQATPQELYLEVTNRCNSRCLTCPLTWGGQEPAHDLCYGLFLALIDELPALRRVVLHGIGEPLLNRDLPGMIAELKRRGVRVLFNTNGIGLGPRLRRQLVDSGLDELRVSLDAGRRESYRRIRGVDAFDRVLANAGALARLERELGRESPRLSLWFTGLSDNISELPDVVRAAARAGVTGVHLQRLVYRGVGLAVAEQAIHDAGDESVVTAVARAEALAEELGVELTRSGRDGMAGQAAGNGRQAAPWHGCTRPWRLAYVTANGNLLPCCIAPFTDVPYESIVLGNVQSGSLLPVWNGERYQEFRRHHASVDHPPECCRACGDRWSL